VGLARFGVSRDALPALAAEASRQWTLQFNPVPYTEQDFIALYMEALGS
jgi:alcohol dehydrogenase class IV